MVSWVKSHDSFIPQIGCPAYKLINIYIYILPALKGKDLSEILRWIKVVKWLWKE